MVTNRNVFIIAETGRPGCNGNSVLSFQVFYKSKLVLKLKILFKKKKVRGPAWLARLVERETSDCCKFEPHVGCMDY